MCFFNFQLVCRIHPMKSGSVDNRDWLRSGIDHEVSYLKQECKLDLEKFDILFLFYLAGFNAPVTSFEN